MLSSVPIFVKLRKRWFRQCVNLSFEDYQNIVCQKENMFCALDRCDYLSSLSIITYDYKQPNNRFKILVYNHLETLQYYYTNYQLRWKMYLIVFVNSDTHLCSLNKACHFLCFNQRCSKIKLSMHDNPNVH